MDMNTTDTSATGTTATGTAETIAQKLLGNPSGDITDATYRFIADWVRSVVFGAVRGDFPEFAHTLIGQQLEQIVGYVLAAAVELAPGQVLLEQRQRLAQNLRVQSYQDFEDKIYKFGKDKLYKFGQEGIKEVIAKGTEGQARGIEFLLQQVREMINEAQYRTDEKINEAQLKTDQKIDEAVERMRGGRPGYTENPC